MPWRIDIHCVLIVLMPKAKRSFTRVKGEVAVFVFSLPCWWSMGLSGLKDQSLDHV